MLLLVILYDLKLPGNHTYTHRFVLRSTNTRTHLMYRSSRLSLFSLRVSPQTHAKLDDFFFFSNQGLKIPDTLPELQPGGTGGAVDSPISSKNNAFKVKKRRAKWQFPVAGEGGGDLIAVYVGGDIKQKGCQEEIEEKVDNEGGGIGGSKGGGGGGGGGEAAAADGDVTRTAAPKTRTAVLHHPLCLEHHSCPPIRRAGADPPPENVKRLQVIYNEVRLCFVVLYLCVCVCAYVSVVCL